MRSNVYLNDIFVFSLLLQADAHQDHFFHVGLKHGWFGMEGLAPWGDEDAIIWGNNKHYHFSPIKSTSGFVAASNKTLFISNFWIGEFLFHHFGYHQKGVLSFQTRNKLDAATFYETKWKLVTDTRLIEQSLFYYLGSVGAV